MVKLIKFDNFSEIDFFPTFELDPDLERVVNPDTEMKGYLWITNQCQTGIKHISLTCNWQTNLGGRVVGKIFFGGGGGGAQGS